MKNIVNNKSVLDITSDIIKYEKKAEALCNDVYLIYAKNGKYIIKIAKDKVRQEELEKEVDLIGKLKNLISLPNILLYSKSDKYSFVLMEYIDGIKIKSFGDDILRTMANTLKLIHNYNFSNEIVDFDELLSVARSNLNSNRLDMSEFIDHKNIGSPEKVLNYLVENKPTNIKSHLLHGDFRPKNMLVSNDILYVLDYGLSFYGDIYYDFAIIKYYLTEDEFNKFIKYYGIKDIDEERLRYNELLSLFLNV